MIERSFQNNESVFLIFLITFFVIGFLRQTQREKLSTFIESFSNTLMIEQQVRQERSFIRLSSYLLLISFLAISVFISQLIQFSGWMNSFSFGALFSIVFVAILLFVALRMSIYTALGWLFELEELQIIHSFHWLQTSFLWAICLLPISILYVFGPEYLRGSLLIIGLVIGIILFLVRTFRVFIAGLSKFRIKIIYNIFYLCALEFVPLIVLISVIFRQKQ